MLAAGHPLQPLGPRSDRAAVAGVALVQSDIEFAELERALLRDAAAAAHIEPQGRPRAYEIRQQLRQPVGCEILRNAQAHDAVGHRPRHHVARLLLERENPPRVGEETLAFLGERRLLAVPLQQRATEFVFEPLDLLADRRLGAVHPLARPREPAGIDNRHETTKKIYIHHRLTSIYRATVMYSII